MTALAVPIEMSSQKNSRVIDLRDIDTKATETVDGLIAITKVASAIRFAGRGSPFDSLGSQYSEIGYDRPEFLEIQSSPEIVGYPSSIRLQRIGR